MSATSIRVNCSHSDHTRYVQAVKRHGFISVATAFRYFLEVCNAEVNYYLFDCDGTILVVGGRDLEHCRLKAVKVRDLIGATGTPVLIKRADPAEADLTGAW